MECTGAEEKASEEPAIVAIILEALVPTVQPETDADPNRQPPAESKEKSEPGRTVHVVLDVPPAERDERAARRKRKDRCEQIRFAVEVSTLILLGVYTTINYCLYRETKITSRGMTGQIALMRQQLNAAQRPALILQSLETVAIKEGGRSLSLAVLNAGHGLAFNIYGTAFWAVHQEGPLAPTTFHNVSISWADKKIINVSDVARMPAWADEEPWNEIKTRSGGTLYIYGWFDYADSLGVHQRDSFCWLTVYSPTMMEVIYDGICGLGVRLNIPTPVPDQVWRQY